MWLQIENIINLQHTSHATIYSIYKSNHLFLFCNIPFTIILQMKRIKIFHFHTSFNHTLLFVGHPSWLINRYRRLTFSLSLSGMTISVVAVFPINKTKNMKLKTGTWKTRYAQMQLKAAMNIIHARLLMVRSLTGKEHTHCIIGICNRQIKMV